MPSRIQNSILNKKKSISEHCNLEHHILEEDFETHLVKGCWFPNSSSLHVEVCTSKILNL